MGLDPRVVATLLGELTPGTIVHAHDSHAHTLADGDTGRGGDGRLANDAGAAQRGG